MSGTNQVAVTAKNIFGRDSVKEKFAEIMGKKSTGFIASVMQVTSTNALLAKADPNTIYTAAMIAATLDLPINQNLGLAYIVPYGNQAQFQMGYRGFIQLAQRTGQYKSINVVEVYKNQFNSFDPLDEELDADFSIDGEGEIAGFVGRFVMLNGYKKTVYWSMKKMVDHAQKYSKSYNSKSSVWKSNFNEMAKKTVIKNMISKWGIMSIENQMQVAVESDQGVFQDAENLNDVSYPDNVEAKTTPSKVIPDTTTFERIKQGIQMKTTTVEAAKTEFAFSDSQLKELETIKK